MDDFNASDYLKSRNRSRHDKWRFKGPWRVFRLCLLAIILPTVLIAGPLYLKYRVYSDEMYPFGMSDMRLLDNKISTIWCQRQHILSNATFNAYLLPDKPILKRDPHIVSLIREITLEDDMKEYWGFYLLKGSTVTVSVCTRRPGSSLIVIRGRNHLQQCAYFGDSSSEEEDELNEIEQNVSYQEMKRARPGVIFHGNVDFHDRYLFSKELDASHGEDLNIELFKKDVKKDDTSHKNSFDKPMITSNELMKSFWNLLKKHKDTDRDLSFLKNKTDDYLWKWLKDAFVNSTNANQQGTNVKTTKNKRDIKLWSNIKAQLNIHDEANDNALEEGVEHDEIRGRFNDRTSNDTSNSEFWSSFSSSEERLLECAGLVLNLPLTPSILCNKNRPIADLELACNAQKISYEVPSNGYYFFVFSSENEIQSTYIRIHFELEKLLYNISRPVATCENSTGQCALPLQFFSKEKLVLELPVNDSLWNTEFLVISSCEPRTWLYAICVLAVPILILLCAF